MHDAGAGDTGAASVPDVSTGIQVTKRLKQSNLRSIID